MTTIKLPISAIKNYVNRASVFINRVKMGLNPFFSCIYLNGDKASVYNGETGAIISFPFTVTEPTLFLPFDLAQVVNSSKEESEITLKFDYKAMVCHVKTDQITITIKMIDPTNYKEPVIETSVTPFEIEGFYEKVKRASFCCHTDASLYLMQGVKFTTTSVCSTDQRAVWREQSANGEEFVLPRLLKDHVERLGLEPSSLGISSGQVLLFYSDMVVFGARLAEDNKFPPVNAALDGIIRPMEDTSVVKYDRDALKERLGMLLALSEPDSGLQIKSVGGVLSVHNSITDSSETEGVISLDVKASADFDNVFVNGELFLHGVERFTQFAVKSDQKKLLFWNENQEYCLSRRDVR